MQSEAWIWVWSSEKLAAVEQNRARCAVGWRRCCRQGPHRSSFMLVMHTEPRPIHTCPERQHLGITKLIHKQNVSKKKEKDKKTPPFSSRDLCCVNLPRCFDIDRGYVYEKKNLGYINLSALSSAGFVFLFVLPGVTQQQPPVMSPNFMKVHENTFNQLSETSSKPYFIFWLTYKSCYFLFNRKWVFKWKKDLIQLSYLKNSFNYAEPDVI